MPCAHTGQAARNDLAALGDKTLKQANIAVGDSVDLLGAELADLLAPEELAATGAAARSTGGTWSARTRARAGVRMAAAGSGCRCVLLIGLRAGFVSHDISLSSALCLPRSRPSVESLNIRPVSVEWKRSAAIVMRCAMRASRHRKSLQTKTKLLRRQSRRARARPKLLQLASSLLRSLSLLRQQVRAALVRSAARCVSPWCRGSP
jgi:hypothetical protein